MKNGGNKSRTTVQVKQDFEPAVSGPANGPIQDGQLPLHIGVAWEWSQGPVPNGNSDVIQTCVGNLSKVIRSNPGVPMLSETV